MELHVQVLGVQPCNPPPSPPEVEGSALHCQIEASTAPLSGWKRQRQWTSPMAVGYLNSWNGAGPYRILRMVTPGAHVLDCIALNPSYLNLALPTNFLSPYLRHQPESAFFL